MCGRAGLRITPQRTAIYKTLAMTDKHPSSDSVFRVVRKEMPNISFDTVNRTLQTFADIGAAFVVEGSGDVKRYDAGLAVHQHFKCVKCKRIIDFHHEPFDNIILPEEINKKFKVLRKTAFIEGLCENCSGTN
ncbi:MAG: transcriptional repressor [Candidatus Brocadiia bacterium]|nr:MAG: transcriptional repressor [Candidatus Brocadiia bacterium]